MEFLNTLWGYLIVSAPYLLFGLLISGIVKSFLSVDLIKDKLGTRSVKSVLLASAVGVPLPLCSCSVIPAAVTLKKSGASHGATSAFLISTPESGIDSVAITYSLMDLPMAIIRPLVAFISAFIAGNLQNLFNDFKEEKTPEHKPHCCSSHAKSSIKVGFMRKISEGIKYAFTDLINDIAFWLLIGIVVGAVIEYFMPANFFEHLNGWTGRLIILAVGLPLYICASASTPIAASMVLKGLSPGSALIFLLVGPATNFSNMAVLQKYLGKKGMMINILVITFVALIAAYFTDMYYEGAAISWKLDEHIHSSEAWWEAACAIILSILLLRGVYVDKIKGLLK